MCCGVQCNILNGSRCSNHNHIVMPLKPESLQSFEIGRNHKHTSSKFLKFLSLVAGLRRTSRAKHV